MNEPQCLTPYTQEDNIEPSVEPDIVRSNDFDEKGATSSVENHDMTHIPIDSIQQTSTTSTNILTQMSQDTYDDGGGINQEPGYQLQIPDNIPATATHNSYVTPSVDLQNKPIAKMKHVHVVTPTKSTTQSNTI